MKRAALLLLLSGCPVEEPMSTLGPKLVSTTPGAMAMNVSPTTALVLEFSAAVDPASLVVTLSPTVPLATTFDAANTVATLAHEAAFDFATQYTVRVSGKDPMGHALSGDTVFAFTTAARPETAPPSLVSSTPADGAMNVATGTTLTLVFSESMDTASVSVTASPAVDWGTAVWSANDTTATFTAVSALAGGTAYANEIAGSDVAGNPLPVTTALTFTTAAASDTTPPTVLTTTSQPSVTFSEAMAAATMTVSPDAGCTLSLDSSATLLTCVPGAPLLPSTQYTVTVPAAQAKDLAMNPMAQDFSFMFTTPATLDTTPPHLLSMSPDGGVGYPRSQALTAVFDEPMDKASAQAALSAGGRQLFYSWNAAGTVLTAVPDGGFAYADVVTWSVAATARDLATNALDAGGSATFQIRKLCTTTHLRSESANDGTVVSYSLNKNRPSYSFDPSTNSVRVGRIATSISESLLRGMLVFPFGTGVVGCSATAVGNALAITSARLSMAQTAVTGTPYPVRAAVDVDWLPYNGDAGFVFSGTSPCRATACSQHLSTSPSLVVKSADVTAMVDAALADRRGAAYKLTLRLVNDSAEAITTTTSDYSTFTDGSALDGGAVLDVSWEYP